MLSFARKKASRWIAIGLLGFVLIAMVITGFGTDGMGGLGGLAGGTTTSGPRLATVDGKAVNEPDLNDLLNRQFAQARQQQPTLAMAAFLEMGAFESLLNQLVVGAAIESFGAAQGLTVSQRMVDREIVNIPAFRNFTGQFDENTFRQALQSQNITEAALRQDISRALMQRQLLGPIALGARAPEGVAREYANLLLEQRRGTIGVIPAELLAGGINPTDAQLAAFYTQNRSRFALPERRVVRYAMIGRERIAAQARATDAEVAAYYRENQAQYGPRQTRTLQQVVLPDQNAANAFLQRVRGGANFADAAAQAGFSAGDIGFANQTQQQFTEASSAEVARAAFAAQQGALVGPIRTELGFHVVRVEAVQATPARALDTVRAEIAQAVEQRKTADLLSALVTRVEDSISDGGSMEDIARANGLQLVSTPPITADGQVIGQTWVIPPELQPLLRGAFEIDPEDPEPVVETVVPNERFALLGIERVIPSAPPPLVQIRDQVRAALVQQQALARARQVAQGIVDAINRGTAPAQAFAAAQPRVPAPQSVDMRRVEISRGGQQVPPPLLALFTLPQGRARIVPAPNGAGWFVVHHAQRTPGDASQQPQLIATTRNEFSNSAADEIAQQFARAVEARSTVDRNTAAIQQMRNRLAGNASAQ
jgi:peptidyl-prolyl cis-trans isomerase D